MWEKAQILAFSKKCCFSARSPKMELKSAGVAQVPPVAPKTPT
jgi:hypothetical protein